MDELEGKVALVTGGAGGLGSATARALAALGTHVVIVDVDEDGGEAVAEEIGGAFFRADVASLEDNRAMIAFTTDRFGGLDFVHLNAGVSSGIGVGEEFDVEQYRRIMGINLDGVVFGTVEALPALRARGGGAIVATASLAGLTAVPYDPFYGANKHAVVGLARSLGPSLAQEGIRFNAICPGFAESAIIAPFRQDLIDGGVPIIPAAEVADVVVGLFEGEMSGECWFVQAGREPESFRFRNLPGPRSEA
ncbi:MAG: SDR family oxidoreductase [Solirubrobacterales bacterium]|nr:SDR family oxidoreductase [Solirubrobacterales bacterium]